MSANTDTVERYLDGFRKNDHTQILSCLTDDIEWTVFGAFHLTGEQASTRRSRVPAGWRRPSYGLNAERRAWVIPLSGNDHR